MYLNCDCMGEWMIEDWDIKCMFDVFVFCCGVWGVMVVLSGGVISDVV